MRGFELCQCAIRGRPSVIWIFRFSPVVVSLASCHAFRTVMCSEFRMCLATAVACVPRCL
ncbi:unnamed protein product [Ectocarpus sp. CCAP 1310/34]|nr:unnamed protein product [Ectocarpus sp. CCAP 1310/34]